MHDMTLLEIKEKLNQGYSKISKDEWIEMYLSAKKLPEEIKEEFWDTPQGHALNQAGVLLLHE